MYRVFLADADADMREFYRSSLQQSSREFQVIGEALDGETALVMIRDLQPDLLIADLDLPFMNMVNKGNYTGTPLGELMALDFVIKELQLYLDTHKQDREAFETLKTTIALYEEGRERYVRLYGPLTITDMAVADTYTWICDPWPWDYRDKTEN